MLYAYSIQLVKSIAIDLDSDVPAYRQVMGELRGLIVRGDLQPGDALLSVRDLGERLGLNLNTIAKAYRLLADDGLIEVRHGSPAVVADNKPKKASAPPEASVRQVRDVLSQWALLGVSRRTAEMELRGLLDEFFETARVKEKVR